MKGNFGTSIFNGCEVKKGIEVFRILFMLL